MELKLWLENDDSDALADHLDRIADLIRDGFTSGDMGAERGWWSLSHAECSAQDAA
jgi:hypothetical protein